MKFTEAGDSWEFTCQHGPQECEGNRVMACMRDQIPNMMELLPVVNCVMEERESDPYVEAAVCMEELGVTSTTPEAVEQVAVLWLVW